MASEYEALLGSSMVEQNEISASNRTIIQEPLEEGRITGRWHSVNCFMVHAKRWPEIDSPSNVDLSGKVSMKEMRWHVDMQHYIYRKLINETHAIFMQLQELPKSDTSMLKSMLKISHQYRSVMQSCVIELQQKLRKDEYKENRNMKEQIELLQIMELFWHLCEIVFIDSKPGGYCINQLLDWIRWHFTEADTLAEAVLSCDEPHLHEDYWQAVIGYVLQGRFDMSIKLLSYHPDENDGTFNAFKSIEELMQKMPVFQGYMELSAQDFTIKWSQWQQECKVRLESGEFSNNHQLEMICEILCGSERALKGNSDLCQSWYELMVSKLLFTEPTVKFFDLHAHSTAAIYAYGGYDDLQPLDEIVLAVMDFDVHKLIRKCSETLPNWWFVAHLTDLLFHCDLFHEHDLGLWQVAADYLVCCSTYGRGYLEEHVERIPLDNDKKATKVLHLCKKHNLNEQANSICKVMAMRALKGDRLGSALAWCIRSKDAVFANLLAERIFNHYMETGLLSHLDVMSNIGSAMLLSDKLTFLGKYREFHKLYNDEQFEEAGRLLLQLLSSSLAPKRFWLTLMVDSLPILEHDKIIFNSSQTYEIMHCLQELQLSINSKQYLDWPIVNSKTKAQEEEENDKLALLRLGLSRNLARAILEEKSSKS
eukprot:gene8967-9923_t